MGWVVSVTPRPRFTPGERIPGTHWTGGWVGPPRAGLNTEATGKILLPLPGIETRSPSHPVRSQTLEEVMTVYFKVTRHAYVCNTVNGWRMKKLQRKSLSNGLMLCGGIVQSVPYTATIFWSIVRPTLTSNHSWFIHQSSLKISADTPSSESGKLVGWSVT
jgi:hypothetical protein